MMTTFNPMTDTPKELHSGLATGPTVADLVGHVLACADDANWAEACALVPELEALAAEARAMLDPVPAVDLSRTLNAEIAKRDSKKPFSP